MSAATISVQRLIPGDMVDLEDDLYGHEEHISEFEYYVVESVVHESEDCVLVHFKEHSVGFPADHDVVYAGNLKED